MARQPRKTAAAAPAIDPNLAPLPTNEGPDDDDSGEGDDDDDDDSGEGGGDDGDGDDGDGEVRNGFVELPPPPRHAPPLVEVSPAQMQDRPPRGNRASGGPPPSPNPRGIRGPRSMSAQDRASSPALKSVQRFQEAAYAEIDTLLATLNFSTRQFEVRVSRWEPETDENGVPCTGLLHTYKQKVTIDQIQQRFGGGLYEIKIWGPHPSTGRQAIIKQETLQIAGNPKPMPSSKDEARERDSGKTSEIAEVMRTIADSNERSQQRILSVVEKQNSKPAFGVNDIVQGLSQAFAPILDKYFAKSEGDKVAEMEARREEREDRRRADDQKREDERNRREDERRAEDKRREEDRLRREEEKKADERRRDEEKKAEEKKREEERERRAEERRAEDKKREEERERAKEDRERAREQAKEEAAERQRQHEREMAAVVERTKADADRQKEFMTMMNNMTNTQLEMVAKRNESGGLESMAANLRLLKDLKDDVNDRGGEPTKMEVFNEGVRSLVDTVAPLARQISSAVNKNNSGGNQQRQNSGQQNQQAQAQQGQQPQVAATANGQPVPVGQTVVVDIGPARRALPAGTASGGMAVPVAQPQNVAQPQAVQNVAQPQAQPVPEQQAGDGEPNEITDFVWPSEGDGMLDVGTKLLKDVDLAIQRNMTAEQIVDKILTPFDEQADTLMSMALGMEPEQLTQFIADNVPSTWAILSPRGEEIVLKAFEIYRAQTEQD